MVTLVSHLTTKCRRKDCQAKSADSARFSGVEQHIFRGDTSAAAIGGVKIPVRLANVVNLREAQRPRRPVDGSRLTLEFEEGADGRLVEVQMEAAIPKPCP